MTQAINSAVVDAALFSAAFQTGMSAPVALAETYQSAAVANSMVMQNGATAQHGMQMIAETSTMLTCALMIELAASGGGE